MRHILIRIEDLETLTARELDELLLLLQHILQNASDLRPAERADIAKLIASALRAKTRINGRGSRTDSLDAR
jgi:hypothetical protein